MTIKYGEYAGCCGKVAAWNRDGSLKVIPHSRNMSPDSMLDLDLEGVQLIPAFEVDARQLRRLVRAEDLYSDFAEKIYPPFNMKAVENYLMLPEDIPAALRNINRYTDCLEKFKEWFWLIQNVFYDQLHIAERYDEAVFSDAPESEIELFSTVYGLTEKLYWKLEERFVSREDTEKYIVKFDYELPWNDALQGTGLEEAAYRAVCEDIESRVRTFQYNRERPRDRWLYSASQKRHVINQYESSEEILHASKAEKALYRKFVNDLFRLNDVQAIKILAWGYYEGDSIYRQSYIQAEKYLRVLYDRTGDPQAANALGHIYYYGLSSHGNADYEKAFRYYSFGVLAGLDESIYMTGEMLVHGKGTVKNIDMGLNLIIDGYREALFQFSDGEFENRFAEYAFYMGNVCRENLILGMGARDAYKFYLEADFAIRKRMAKNSTREDVLLKAEISIALNALREHFKPDPERSVLKADFPIYISHMFEDRFPVRIHLYQKGRTYYLDMSRFRFLPGDSSRILVTFPELSYVNLVSELKFRLEDVGVIKLPEKGGSFLADGFNKNEHTNALEFYSGGELVAAVEAKWFIIDVTKEKKLLKMNQGE